MKKETRSNVTLCFIDHLPTETLEDIFILGAHEYYSTASGDPIPSAPKWVNVSYVNRHWRNVALNCSILWTFLFNASPGWTEALLIRSKQAPLKFRMERIVRDMRQVLFLEQVIDHAERFQEASLPLSPSTYHLLSKLSSPAPYLQVLALPWGPSPLRLDRTVRITQPFGGNTPALRTLSLSHSVIPWYSFKNFSRLTDLSISHVPLQVQQSTEEFLTMLRCIQDLTHLHLDMTLPSAAGFLSSMAFHTFQKISLPHLSRLSISDRIPTAVALLSCIDIPWKAEVKITCNHIEMVSSDDHYTLLGSLIAQRVNIYNDQAPCGQSISCLFISFHRQMRVAFGTFGGNHSYPEAIGWKCDIPLQISCFFPQGSRERLASRLCCPTPFPNIEKVHVSYPPPLQAFWMDVLGNLPGIRCLELKRGRMPPIAPLLSFTPHDGTEDQSGHPLEGEAHMFAPGLEALEFENIQFSALREDDCNALDTLRASTLQSLHDALSTRADAPIRMRMIRCSERGPGVPKNKLDDVVDGRKDFAWTDGLDIVRKDGFILDAVVFEDYNGWF